MIAPATLAHALDVAALVNGHDHTTPREDVLAAALVAIHTPLVAAVIALPTGAQAKLLRLLMLGTEEELAARLGAARDVEKSGERHALTATTQAEWLEATALGMWRELGKGARP